MAVRSIVTTVLVLITLGNLADHQAVAQPVTSTLKRMEWKVGDKTREALVSIPDSPADAPVVFVWHGHGGTMRHAGLSFGIHKLWPEAIVAYPQGLPTPGKLIDPEGKRSGWQSAPGDQDDRDLRFFDAMLATFKRDLKADGKKVYATGHSNGGRFVYVLWVARPDDVAAFAPSASPAIALAAQMKPRPCLHVAGETDKLVSFASQQRTMERVRKLNDCDAEGRAEERADEGKVTTYASKSGTPFVSAVFPGGHAFPKEAPKLIADFFKQQASR